MDTGLAAGRDHAASPSTRVRCNNSRKVTMKTLNSSPTISPSSSIKVDIFDAQYTIKPTNSLTEENIRELADYVDRMMHQVSQKGTHDTLSVAIMVALNIAAQVRDEQHRYTDSIGQMIRLMDEAMEGETFYDTRRGLPRIDPKRAIRGPR